VRTVESILDAAAKYLAADESHWHQGGLKNRKGGVCAIGAIDMLTDDQQHATMAELLLADVIAEQYPNAERYHSSVSVWAGKAVIPSWNDDEKRQYHEVVAVFEKARALAAEKGL